MKKIILMALLCLIIANCAFSQDISSIKELMLMAKWFPGQVIDNCKSKGYVVDTTDYKANLKKKYVVLSYQVFFKIFLLYDDNGMSLWYQAPDPHFYLIATEEMQQMGLSSKEGERRKGNVSVEVYDNVGKVDAFHNTMIAVDKIYNDHNDVENYEYHIIITPQ
jgi:uncharacterized protein YcfL